MSETKKINLAMLFANWYSGATLLTILVNNHSQIVSNGETFPFSITDTTRYQCSCGKYTDECEFYRFAASHMRNQDDGDWNRYVFEQTPRYPTLETINRYLSSVRYDGALRSYLIDHYPKWRYRRDEFMRAQHEFFIKAMEFNNASVYVDGMKSIRRAQYFVRDEMIELKVINLVRDGRAFSSSYIKNEGLSAKNISQAASYWNQYLQQSDIFRARFPQVEIIDIRYEDLCRDQEQTLGKLYTFLGLEYQPFDIGRNCMHILGNRMRKTFTGEVKENVEWKAKLSQSVIDQITHEMRDYLTRYGYIQP